MKISAIILAKNESSQISKCLVSLLWADEIIVVDNGSTDDTREVAKKQGAIVVSAGDIRDFTKLRTIGKEKAHGEWLLYIDADEIVTHALAKEIKEAVSRQPSAVRGYEIKRKNYYLGHPWPGDEYILRFMRKDALTEWYGELHETARVTGEVGRLNAPMLHDTHKTLEEMITKTNIWSNTEAHLRFNAGHPRVAWWRLVRVMFTGFFTSYIMQQGWRAGIVGLIESIYQGCSMFITYAKLWEMQQKDQR